MSTFTPANQAATAPAVTIPDDYASSMETIAPGITALLAQNQGAQQNWFDALSQLIPTLNCTPLQSQLLMQEVTNAQAGLPPVDPTLYASTSPVTSNAASSTLSPVVLAAMGLVALLVFK